MANPFEIIIGQLFVNIFGSSLMMGLFGLLFLVVLGVALRLSFEAFIVVLLPAIFLMSVYGLLPAPILWGLVIIGGFIIFMALMRLVNR